MGYICAKWFMYHLKWDIYFPFGPLSFFVNFSWVIYDPFGHFLKISWT